MSPSSYVLELQSSLGEVIPGRYPTGMSYLYTIQYDVKKKKMTETLHMGYSSESTQRELSTEYQYDRVYVFSKICVRWTKVA